jgi:hypothetical protein
MRIVSKWQEGLRPDDMAKIGEALGYNTWKIALKSIQNMQDQRLYFVSKMQGLLVIAEFMIFEVQVADRLAHSIMDDENRASFVKTMADRTIAILADNREDFQGPGEYRDDFVKIFNDRLKIYADFSFDDDKGPGYQFYRYLGEQVGKIMGDDQDNKWSIDQVMEIEGPDTYKALRKSMESLIGI